MKHLILTILALSSLVSCTTERDERPNIVLVTVDTLRWDYLNTYGFPIAGHTPTATRLAENGTVFMNAVATAGTTIPSHGSMLTGQYARNHGARSNFHHKYPNVPTVTSALKDAGYQTGAFVSNLFLFNVGGLAEGFERTNFPAVNDPDQKHPYPGDLPVQAARDWMQELNPDDPMFLWLHLWEPHGPYEVNDWSREQLGDYDGMLVNGVSLEDIRFHVPEILNDPANVDAMKTIYAGEVRRADQLLGEFLDGLERAGKLDNTVVIFTSDHGQSLGEAQRMGHGPVHRETVLRVPLIIADFRNPRHHEVDTRAGTIDISPTIAELAGLNEPFDRAGQSLVDPESIDPEFAYFAETAVRSTTDKNWERVKDNKTYDVNALAVYSGDMKMVQKHGKARLYRTGNELLIAEPLKLRDEPIMADYLQGLIESFQATPVDLTSDQLSKEDLEALQGLGYTQ
jgi:arylsulfatase A-like enzyme